MGGQIHSRHQYGGPNSLIFNKITILPLLFLSRRGGQTPLPISMGGHGRICPPGSATGIVYLYVSISLALSVSVYLSVSLHLPLSLYLSACASVSASLAIQLVC